jgi:hypothetical protein
MMGIEEERVNGRLRFLAGICIVIGAVTILGAGCGNEESSWWSRVTVTPDETLGFDDLWEADYPVGVNITFQARIMDGNLGRLDFSRAAGGYGVVYNNGRTVRIHDGVDEVAVDRTLFLLYILPFMGQQRLGETLYQIGVDTSLVVSDIEWDGRSCFIVGDSLHQEEPIRKDAKPLDIGGDTNRKPAIYFDAETGGVVRLITVDTTPIGKRIGDFRLFDHQQRGGGWLPNRFETYSRGAGMRSRVRLSTHAEGKSHQKNLYTIPDKID